jgi:hypothetical protein
VPSAGIETQPGRARHQRVALEPRVLARVRHHHLAFLQQRELADRVVERHLARAEPDFRLEPLASLREQVDGGDRCIQQLAQQTDEVVEAALPRRIEDAVGVQHRQALVFGADREGRVHRRAVW